MITIGTIAPPHPARRIRMGAAGIAALQRALPDLPLPTIAPIAPDELTPEVEEAITAAAVELREAGVLQPDRAPVPAVRDNLHALTGAPNQLDLRYDGVDGTRIARLWCDADLGGSLVASDGEWILSLFEASTIGDEIADLLPPASTMAGRVAFAVPLTLLHAIAGEPDAADGPVGAALADFNDSTPDTVRLTSDWVADHRGILRCSVIGPERSELLVWTRAIDGWWTGSRTNDTLTLEPRDPADFRRELAASIARCWA